LLFALALEKNKVLRKIEKKQKPEKRKEIFFVMTLFYFSKKRKGVKVLSFENQK
jgi:hypothetical protein